VASNCRSPSARLLACTSEDCHENLATFCDEFLAPPSIPPARRLYDIKSQEDMAQLSIRFLGASADRLVRTVEISNGLHSPASTKNLRVPPIPPHLFPQGRLKTGKSPKVKKGKVGNLHHAGIAEVVFTDTFESGDSRRKYCQVFYDYISRFGYVTAMRSKTEIGDAFADFCCQCWVPLILVRDNAGENVGGSLVHELRARNVRSAFICPHRSKQNFAEGYIGRITVMASFGMVYSDAPLFMWVHALKAAEFISNITATYYSKQDIWATPYELIHGERFPDASVVVPFECAALILLDSDEQTKFQSRCSLMLFMHYADRHPLFTYAFYSPKTKRIVYRQDCIFLPTLFPMRQARSQAGLHPDGEPLVTYRSPPVMRDGPSEVSFQSWSEADPLPSFDDDVTGFELFSEGCFPEEVHVPRPPDHPANCPNLPEFAPSFVQIPIPTIPGGPTTFIRQPGPVSESALSRRSSRTKRGVPSITAPGELTVTSTRKPVRERWFYEPLSGGEPSVALLSIPASSLVSPPPLLSFGDAPDSLPFSAPPPGSVPGEASALSYSSVVPGRATVSNGQDRLLASSSHRNYTPLRFPGHVGKRFNIRLSYPDGEHPWHFYSVFHGMPVSGLRYNISCLLLVDSPVFLYVGPAWESLDHEGTITDRVYPGTSQPCPFLVPDSEVRVHRFRLRSPAVLPQVSASLPIVGSSLVSSVSPGLASPSIVDSVPILSLSAVSALPLVLSDSSRSDSSSSFVNLDFSLNNLDSILDLPAPLLVTSDSNFPHSLPLASFSAFPASPLVVPVSVVDNSTISVPVLATSVLAQSRDGVEISSSLSGSGIARFDTRQGVGVRVSSGGASDHGTNALFRSSSSLKTNLSRPLCHLDSAAHHSSLQILNPPGSDDSEDGTH
jgi:hypothetical protein